MTTTMSLHDFLLAGITEDEAVARSATPGPWYWSANANDLLSSGCIEGSAGPDSFTPLREYRRLPHEAPPADAFLKYEAPAGVCWAQGYEDPEVVISDADKAHIARVHPTRVLAECEAKRRVIESATGDDGRGEQRYGCPASDNESKDCLVYDTFLAAMAAVYADHPDYDPEWATAS